MTMKRQEFPWSCGAASVRNVLRAYGTRVSEKQIRKYSDTTKQFGTCEEGIINALKEWELAPKEHHFDCFEEAWNWLHKTLLRGRKVILAVENWEHWVTALGSNGPAGIVVFDSSNFKNNTYENGTHIWDRDHLHYKWWNSRSSIDDEEESRIYAISV